MLAAAIVSALLASVGAVVPWTQVTNNLPFSPFESAMAVVDDAYALAVMYQTMTVWKSTSPNLATWTIVSTITDIEPRAHFTLAASADGIFLVAGQVCLCAMLWVAVASGAQPSCVSYSAGVDKCHTAPPRPLCDLATPKHDPCDAVISSLVIAWSLFCLLVAVVERHVGAVRRRVAVR